MPKQYKNVVVSGIRATGRLHLGNYFGVLERLAELSNDPDTLCFFFIADLHTLTTLQDAKLIRDCAPEIALDFVAAGVNPERAIIYVQSQVPSVCELTWMLACLTPHGDLGRMPTFKDKAEKHADNVNAGLYMYPALMAADILGPHGTQVPVGPDQLPHIELARDIAARFNGIYGEYFPLPNALTSEDLKVPALALMNADGSFPKMGKSDAPQSTLFLSETGSEMRDKLWKAPTDPARARREDPGNPQKCCIYRLHDLASSNDRIKNVREGCTTAGITCRDCKSMVAESLGQRLTEFRTRRAELSMHPGRMHDILREGAKKANAVFAETTHEVGDRMGLYRFR